MVTGQKNTAPLLCKPCNKLFPNADSLWKHKEQKRKEGVPGHRHCRTCDLEFVTQEAETSHVQKYHPKEQCLECPGCGDGPFTRLGALMSHVESGECGRINAKVLEEVRNKKFEFAQKLEEMTNEPIKHNYAKFVAPTPDVTILNAQAPIREAPAAVAVSSALRSSDFPALPGTSLDTRFEDTYDQLEEAAQDFGWSGDYEEKLQPKAPAVVNAGKQPQSVPTGNVKTVDQNMDIHHPDHPSFDAQRYWNEFSEKFRCPKQPCGKSFPKARNLINHLRSPAHGPLTYRCPSCMGRFKTLTALTMHVESTGSRCRMRESTSYNPFIDQLTAGMVDVNIKRNDDGTVAYSTNESAKELYQNKGNGVPGKSFW